MAQGLRGPMDWGQSPSAEEKKGTQRCKGAKAQGRKGKAENQKRGRGGNAGGKEE